jgi:hypothetical protein
MGLANPARRQTSGGGTGTHGQPGTFKKGTSVNRLPDPRSCLALIAGLLAYQFHVRIS